MRSKERWTFMCMLLLAAVACTDTPATPPVSTPAPAPIPTASKQPTKSEDAKADFHANNRMDWVGAAHNKGLADITAKLTKGHGTSDVCVAIEKEAAKAEHIPLGHDARSDAERTRAAKAGLAKSDACASRYALSSNDSVRLVKFNVLVASESVDDFSPLAQSILDQIDYGIMVAGSSSDLAARLNPLVAQANSLPSGESELVLAVASVSQSSFEYWEANMVTTYNQLQSAYGTCLAQYSDQASGLSHCMGISGPPVLPTSMIASPRQGVASFVSFSPRVCHDPKVSDMAHVDFVTGISGGLVGLATAGPAGALAGVLIGGLGGSAAEGWWGVGAQLWCYVNGGVAPKDHQSQT